MKKLNKKGFTLIELLAVITIMGILMLVAIPAVSRTIENSRRDTFMNTAKSYANAIKNAVAADELTCGSDSKRLSAMQDGYYYVSFKSNEDSGKDLMEQGGKSSWGNVEVKGTILIKKGVRNNRNTYEYYVAMIDEVGRGIGTSNASGVLTRMIPEDKLSRSNVATKDDTNKTGKKYFDTALTTAPVANNTTVLSKTGNTPKIDSAPVACSVEM